MRETNYYNYVFAISLKQNVLVAEAMKSIR